MFIKKIKEWYNKEDHHKKQYIMEDVSQMVAYVNRLGTVRFVSYTVSPDYMMGVFGMTRAPHLDFPRIKNE